MKDKVWRISSNDIPKIKDLHNIITPEYKAVRKMFYGDEKVKEVRVKKRDDGKEVIVDIYYNQNTRRKK